MLIGMDVIGLGAKMRQIPICLGIVQRVSYITCCAKIRPAIEGVAGCVYGTGDAPPLRPCRFIGFSLSRAP